MKTTAALCLALVASAAPFLNAAEVAPGATLDEVRQALGAPKGQLQRQGRQVLTYERGTVELQAGRVTQVALRSPEEHAAWVAKEERIRAEQEALRSRLVEEGTALRDRKLADPAFQSAPLAYQVSFWENFARSYPGVSCAEPLTVARLRLNEQLDAQRRQDEETAARLAEIEERFAASARSDFYPIPVFYSSYRGRHRYHRQAGLGPITYHFSEAPSLTPYSTPAGTPYSVPAGNPAGSLTGPVVDLPSHNSARSDWKHDTRPGGRWQRPDEWADRLEQAEPARDSSRPRRRM